MARYLHIEAANVIAHLVAGQVSDNVEAAKIETLTAQLVEKALANAEHDGMRRAQDQVTVGSSAWDAIEALISKAGAG